jgi:hypothetical protein
MRTFALLTTRCTNAFIIPNTRDALTSANFIPHLNQLCSRETIHHILTRAIECKLSCHERSISSRMHWRCLSHNHWRKVRPSVCLKSVPPQHTFFLFAQTTHLLITLATHYLYWKSSARSIRCLNGFTSRTKFDTLKVHLT